MEMQSGHQTLFVHNKDPCLMKQRLGLIQFGFDTQTKSKIPMSMSQTTIRQLPSPYRFRPPVENSGDVVAEPSEQTEVVLRETNRFSAIQSSGQIFGQQPYQRSEAPSSDGPLNFEMPFSQGSDFIFKSRIVFSVTCRVRDWLKGEQQCIEPVVDIVSMHAYASVCIMCFDWQ